MAKNNAVAVVEEVRSNSMRLFEEAAASMVADDPSADDMLVDILTATTVDDILGGNAIHLQDIIGTPFTINKATLRESDYDAGLPAFVVLNVTFDGGNNGVVTTGASTVVAQVIRMHQIGVFPQRVNSYKTTKPTKAGYYPVQLVKADPLPESF